ncbi:hypothetical protein BHE74_00016816 [Ensete ventricosum]|nr:hypothetical protein GW17_00031419 [Ensete ventricosum]RWW75170.1 hypothetical protein BHE74_00016816 [Ensete ventricosum]RZS05360.1 hypothetical protein BHM03_00035860 [Ensete ventricosum]
MKAVPQASYLQAREATYGLAADRGGLSWPGTLLGLSSAAKHPIGLVARMREVGLSPVVGRLRARWPHANAMTPAHIGGGLRVVTVTDCAQHFCLHKGSNGSRLKRGKES